MESLITNQNTPTVELLLTRCSNGDQIAKFELIKYERNVSIEKCVLSKEKNIYSLAQKVETEIEILKYIFLLTQRFLQANFPDSSIDATATQFSQDIVELRRDWVLDDIISFFKFIRQRQDIEALKTYGSKITNIKLLEFSTIYEDARCEVKENIINKRKEERLNQNNAEQEVMKVFSAKFGKEIAEKMRVKKNEDNEEKRMRGIKTNQFHKDNEFCINWLKSKKINEDDYIKWYHLFLIRK